MHPHKTPPPEIAGSPAGGTSAACRHKTSDLTDLDKGNNEGKSPEGKNTSGNI